MPVYNMYSVRHLYVCIYLFYNKMIDQMSDYSLNYKASRYVL